MLIKNLLVLTLALGLESCKNGDSGNGAGGNVEEGVPAQPTSPGTTRPSDTSLSLAGVYESQSASGYSAVKVVDDTISVFVFYMLPEDAQMKILNRSGNLFLREKIIGRKVAADSNSVTYKIERASCESTVGYTIKVSLSNGKLTLEDVPMLNLKIDGNVFKQFAKSDKTADWDRVAEDVPEDKKNLIAETCFGRVGEDYSLRVLTE